MKPLRKSIFQTKINTNTNFAIKLAERSNHPFSLSIWWITVYLMKPLKILGFPSKKSPSTNICLTKDNTTIFADKENTNIFKKFYSTLADDLVKNLPPASSIFGLSSMCQYYNKTLKLPNIFKWGNDGTKITTLSVMFHRSFTTMWYHFNPQMQNFIDNFHVPSLVQVAVYVRNYWKTESHNYPVDWGNVGTYQG